MSKKKCNTIELKKLGNFGILSSLDGDSMAERNYSKEYAREKEQRKLIGANLPISIANEFDKCCKKNGVSRYSVLKQFIIDYIDKNKS